MFPKSKAKSHINSCKGSGPSGASRFSDYSPIKEADDEGHQPGEESKDSSVRKVKKPSKVEDSDSSYTSDTESKSLSAHQSSAKGRKRSGRKKEHETESSISQSADPAGSVVMAA